MNFWKSHWAEQIANSASQFSSVILQHQELRFEWVSVVIELALDEDLGCYFAGQVREHEKNRRNLAWWYFYQVYLPAELRARCGALPKRRTLIERGRFFHSLRSNLGIFRSFSSRKGRVKETRQQDGVRRLCISLLCNYQLSQYFMLHVCTSTRLHLCSFNGHFMKLSRRTLILIISAALSVSLYLKCM